MHKTLCLGLFYKEVVVYIYTTSGILRSLLSIAVKLHIKPLYHFHHVMFDVVWWYDRIYVEKIDKIFDLCWYARLCHAKW